MCGIAGFNWPDQRLVKTMMDALRHRGPDDEGFYVDDAVSLGHRRLSIVDLSEMGHQPMVYEHGGRRAIVTFNGEIFNFHEVRAALAGKGYRFRSESDTEIVLASYIEWGSDCVHHFNGMWAFALYDEAEKRLLLSRDRFGEKPLHYRLNDGNLIFASEIKAILAHPVRRRANREIVSDYLYKGEAQGRLESFFEDILMLPPAHNAVFDLRAKRMTLARYYEPRHGRRRVAPDEFRAALKKAVERRLIADNNTRPSQRRLEEKGRAPARNSALERPGPCSLPRDARQARRFDLARRGPEQVQAPAGLRPRLLHNHEADAS